MSTLTRALRIPSRPFLRLSPSNPTYAPSPASRAPLSTTPTRHVGQESSLHHENRAEEAEHHKQDQLQKQKEGKNHWKPELASDSEHHIKADKEGHDASPEGMEKLQRETADLPAKKSGQK